MIKKMMTKTTTNVLKAFVIADSVLIIASVIFFDIKVLYNTQIGFFSSALVMLASMKSYKRMVDARVANNIITMDASKDIIDKLEDPHDLYSEEVTEADEEKDLAATIKEEKKRLKANRRSLGQTIKDTKAALSVYRLGAYFLLVIGFLYLNRHGLLNIPSYLVALTIPIVLMVFVLIREKEKQTQDSVK